MHWNYCVRSIYLKSTSSRICVSMHFFIEMHFKKFTIYVIGGKELSFFLFIFLHLLLPSTLFNEKYDTHSYNLLVSIKHRNIEYESAQPPKWLFIDLNLVFAIRYSLCFALQFFFRCRPNSFVGQITLVHYILLLKCSEINSSC